MRKLILVSLTLLLLCFAAASDLQGQQPTPTPGRSYFLLRLQHLPWKGTGTDDSNQHRRRASPRQANGGRRRNGLGRRDPDPALSWRHDTSHLVYRGKLGGR